MYIIDRMEGDWAVIEGEEKTFNLPRRLLPEDAGEGDVLKITIEIDRQGNRSRMQKVKQLVEDVFEDGRD